MQSKNLLALVVALAVGAAAAQTTGTAPVALTPAGTDIKNVATATYTDPADATKTLTSTSNEVITTVLPKPNFDVIFKGNTPTDGGTQDALPTTTSVTTGATPGQEVPTLYTVVNNGNVPLVVNLTADTTGAAAGQTVEYFLADATGAPIGNAITSVNLPVDEPGTPANEGLVQIVQVITVPTTATPTDVYGATPVGTVTGTGETTNGYATGTTVYEENTASKEAADLQYHRVQIFTPGLTNDPNPGGTPTGTPIDPGGDPITPISNTPVEVPTLPPGNTDPTPNTPPTEPQPGYPSNDPVPTPIIPNLTGDIQEAYPKADRDDLPDQVTFTNTLTNTGDSPDKVQLFPEDAVNPDGSLKSGYSYNPTTATFTRPDGTTVQFLDPAGNPIPQKDGSLYPAFDAPADSTVYYQTRVTYPDPDDSTPVTPITVVVGADSLNDAGVVSNASTTNKIYPAAAQFGDDSDPQGAVPTPTPVQTVSPTAPVGAPLTSPNDGTDRTAVFLMDVANTGTYTDSFKLKGTVDVDGTPVPVRYVDATTGLPLTQDADGNYITPVVAPGTEYKVLAVIDMPEGTAAGDYTVNQTATGSYSTIPMSDTNNIIRVAVAGEVAVAKFAAKAPTAAGAEPVNGIENPADFSRERTAAQPGDVISYRIIAKNNYNQTVPKIAICDVVPLNTRFQSIALVPAPTAPARAIYSADGGTTWVATPPAAGAENPTNICVALDADGNNQPDALDAGATLSADFKVTVK